MGARGQNKARASIPERLYDSFSQKGFALPLQPIGKFRLIKDVPRHQHGGNAFSNGKSDYEFYCFLAVPANTFDPRASNSLWTPVNWGPEVPIGCVKKTDRIVAQYSTLDGLGPGKPIIYGNH